MGSKPHSAIQDLLGRIEAQQKKCIRAARKYIPKGKVTTLLIGESPPSSGSYFYLVPFSYCRGQSLPAKVFRSMSVCRPVLERSSGKLNGSAYRECLALLKDNGFFLMDLCPYPIDAFTSRYRIDHIRANLRQFVARFNSLRKAPNINIVLVLPHGTLRILKREKEILARLRQSGLHGMRVVPWSALEDTLKKQAH
jgi:hypothetical protein